MQALPRGDFVHDQLATGRKIRVLTMIDTFSRYVPVLDLRFSCRGEDVVATLEREWTQIGYPKIISVEQGLEFISRDLSAFIQLLAGQFVRKNRKLLPDHPRGHSQCRVSDGSVRFHWLRLVLPDNHVTL